MFDSRWCSCGVDGEHLAGFGAVCADVAGAAAVVPPIVSTPLVGSVASSHRTSRTSLPTSNTGYGSYRVTAPRSDVPANEGFGRVGRFVY